MRHLGYQNSASALVLFFSFLRMIRETLFFTARWYKGSPGVADQKQSLKSTFYRVGRSIQLRAAPCNLL